MERIVDSVLLMIARFRVAGFSMSRNLVAKWIVKVRRRISRLEVYSDSRVCTLVYMQTGEVLRRRQVHFIPWRIQDGFYSVILLQGELV